MKRVDRRTFLLNSMRTGAVVAAAGSVAYYEWELFETTTSHAADLPGAPEALKVNDDASPVGVDPDDVNFAWQVSDPRKGAIQSAYRIVVAHSGSEVATVWDSGDVESGRQAFVAYTGPALDADAAYSSPFAPATIWESGAVRPNLPRSSRACAGGTGRRSGCGPDPRTQVSSSTPT